MTLKFWQFINIFLSALVAGVFWGPWLGLSRSIASFNPEAFLAIGKTMIGNLAPVMPILMPAAILSTLPVLFLLYGKRASRSFAITLAGLALFLAALLITLLVEVPIDNQIKRWTLTSLPDNWKQLRDRWEVFHAVRTFASLGGLALIIAGALRDGESTPDTMPRHG